QSLPGWIHNTDRPISPLRSAKDPQGNTMKRVKGVEDLNICIIGAQGIVGVGAVHMIVPGGGISPDGGRWVCCCPGFFLPVRVLPRLFRRLLLQKLVAAYQAGRLSFFGDHADLADAQCFAAYLAPLRKVAWVVYAKRPFGGPEAVLAYLSRYTHRVA